MFVRVVLSDGRFVSGLGRVDSLLKLKISLFQLLLLSRHVGDLGFEDGNFLLDLLDSNILLLDESLS